jgi:hypothetical protein
VRDKNACPVCGANIGIAAVFKAPLPNRIFCPHCGERLQYRNSWWLVLAVVLVMIAATGGGLFTAAALGAKGVWVGIVMLAHLLAAGVACEVAFVLMLWYGSFELEPVNPRPPAWHSEDDF